MSVCLRNSGAGIITNVGVTNVNVTGYDYVGGIVGQALTNSILQYVYATGSVTGLNITPPQFGVGGLVGQTSGGLIQLSYNAATVSAPTRIGGIAGQLGNSTVVNSYNIGTIIGWQNAAGTTTNGYIGGPHRYDGSGWRSIRD